MKKQAGYSLLELLGVLAVLGIVISIAVPNLTRAKRHYQLQSTTQQIAQVLQAAKLDAIGKNTSRKVVCDLTTNTITAANGTVIALPAGIRFEALSSTVTAPNVIASAATNALPQQASDAKTAVSFPVGSAAHLRELSFNWKGLPAVEPGVVNWIYLRNDDGQRMAVTLTSAGSATISEWKDSQWK